VTLAGLGNVPAAIPTAFLVGVLETLAYHFAGGGWQDAPSLLALIVLLLFKPTGLFGSEVKS
jgi:branched-chain amino acid transport system permease protein